MLETHQLMQATARVVNHKRMAHALAVSLPHTYVLCADPLTQDAPVRNDADRLTNLLTELASHRDGKPTLVLWELYFAQLFGRLVRNEKPAALTCETIIPEAQKLCAHMADVLAECKPGFVPNTIAKEAAEMIAALRTLIECAEEADDTPATRVRIAR